MQGLLCKENVLQCSKWQESPQANPEQVASVSFTQLFWSTKILCIFWGQCSPTSRYSTKFKIFLDVIGVIMAAGAGEPRCVYIFSQWVREALMLLLLTSLSHISTFWRPNPTVYRLYPCCSKHQSSWNQFFQTSCSSSSLLLILPGKVQLDWSIYVGEFKHNARILLILKIYRCWIVCLHIYLHVHLKLYQRSQCQTYPGTLSPSIFMTGCCFLWQCWCRRSSNPKSNGHLSVDKNIH